MQIGPVIKEAERLWHTNIQRGLIWRGPGIAPESRQSNLLQLARIISLKFSFSHCNTYKVNFKCAL